jgi:hypothetical protein
MKNPLQTWDCQRLIGNPAHFSSPRLLIETAPRLGRSRFGRGKSRIVSLIAALSWVFIMGQESTALATIITRNIGVTLDAANIDSYNLDVDGNGTIDFTFQAAYVPDPTLPVGFDQITFLFGSDNAAVIDTQTGDGFPPVSLLLPGATVSSASLFSSPIDTGDLYYNDSLDPITGNFAGNTGFVGFRFDGVGGIHYGYVEVTVNSPTDPTNPLDLTLGTLVYNDVANAGLQITAVPEPGSLGLASLLTVATAMGLEFFSRRKSGTQRCG